MIIKYLNILIVSIVLVSCANEIPPTGGPKDVMPPRVLTTFPDSTNNLNFKEKEIVIEFDEYIEANSFKKNTIISPDPGEYKYQIRKKKLYITFDEALKENTTYRIILNKSVRDITERNDALNIQLAFSTGPYLDSLSIKGETTMLMYKGKTADVLVGLYVDSDSLDIRKAKPDYYTYSNILGRFNLRYLKAGQYQLFAFKDNNNNLKFDIKNEPVAFLPTAISLTNSIDSIHFELSAQDTTDLTLLRGKGKGNHHELIFNKGVKNITFRDSILFEPEKDGKNINLYTKVAIDSVALMMTYSDSSDTKFTDTVYLKKERVAEKLKLVNKIEIVNDVRQAKDTLKVVMSFYEPIKKYISDSISIKIDTLKTTPKEWSSVFNQSRTSLTLKRITTHFVDTISISFPDSVFTSFYGTKNKKQANSKILKPIEEFGAINGNITTEEKSYQLQLLNKKFEAVRITPFNGQSSFSFLHLQPGEYKLRVLIDKNNDGRYDKGDIAQHILPEPVYLFPEAIIIRKNWEITDIQLKF